METRRPCGVRRRGDGESILQRLGMSQNRLIVPRFTNMADLEGTTVSIAGGVN